METEQGLIDLSGRAVFRLSGADRVRYLNGQVSNDVAKASAETVIEACVCNLKGKLEGVISITETSEEDAFLIDAPGELRESLFLRLDRYIIADDCELEDVSDEMALVHAIGEPAVDLPGAAWRASNRFGSAGFDLWTTPDSLAAVLGQGRVLSPEVVEEIRMLHGVPKWGADIDEEVLPAEARIEKRAVDFVKGCYLGQEVISRIESVGKVNRLLTLVVAEKPGAVLESGWGVFPEGAEKAIGRIGSTIFSRSLERSIGLAILKRAALASEAKLVTGPEPDKVETDLQIREFKDGGQ